jgi:hypothetical protein
VSVPEPETWEEEMWLQQRFPKSGEAKQTCLEAIERMTSWGPYEVVLEKDRIRVVPRTQAVDLWLGWQAVHNDE